MNDKQLTLFNGACDVLDTVENVVVETGATRAEVLQAIEIAALQMLNETLKGIDRSIEYHN